MLTDKLVQYSSLLSRPNGMAGTKYPFDTYSFLCAGGLGNFCSSAFPLLTPGYESSVLFREFYLVFISWKQLCKGGSK